MKLALATLGLLLLAAVVLLWAQSGIQVIPSAPVTLGGTNAFTGNNTHGGTETATGLLQCKNFESIKCVEPANSQGWTGSDFGAWVNAAIASLPLMNGYAMGEIYLFPPSTGVQVTQSTTVSIVSPYLSIFGPGAGALQIVCTMNADCWNIHVNPFVINPGGLYRGFSIVGQGTLNANANGLHLGDMIGAHFEDIDVDNFRGANSSCVWFDNINGFFERNWLTGMTVGIVGAHQNGCTKLWRWTNTGGTFNTSSFGHNHYMADKFSVLAGQTAFSFEGGANYDSSFSFTGNVSTGSNAIVLAMSGLAYSGGSNTQLDGSWDFSVECTSPCTAGTLLNIPAGYNLTIRSGGFLDSSGLLTNSVSGNLIHPLNTTSTQQIESLRLYSNTRAGNFYAFQVNNPSTNRTLSISDPGGAAAFLFDIGAQNLTSKNLVNPALISTIGGNPYNFTVTNPGSARTINISDPGATSGLVFVGGSNANRIERGSCAMSAGTTCTWTASAALASTPLCFVSIDQASAVPVTAISAKCAISGKKVTITAGASNSLTWDALLVGQPN